MPRKRIPFIACEFDVFDAAAAIALATGKDESKIFHGLLKLWRRCWETKTDLMHEGMIDGYLPAGCIEHLVLFGYAERWQGPKLRIKGLDRYVRIRKSRPGDKEPTPGPSQGPFGTDQGPQGGTSGPLFGPKGAERGGKTEDRRLKTDLKEDLSFDFIDDEPKARKLSVWEELWADMCEERIARLEVLNVQGPDHFEPVAERITVREVNALLSELAGAVEEMAGESFSDAATEISGTWRHYLIDGWGKKLKPEPFALRAFCSFKVWPRHWRSYNETAMGGVG